jgi:hypothetical protein
MSERTESVTELNNESVPSNISVFNKIPSNLAGIYLCKIPSACDPDMITEI